MPSLNTWLQRKARLNEAKGGARTYVVCDGARVIAFYSLTDNKTQPKTRIKTPDSLRQGASQAAGAAPTLRYGPAGDSAPRLRLKAAGMTERFPSGPFTRAEATRQPGPSTPFPS